MKLYRFSVLNFMFFVTNEDNSYINLSTGDKYKINVFESGLHPEEILLMEFYE